MKNRIVMLCALGNVLPLFTSATNLLNLAVILLCGLFYWLTSRYWVLNLPIIAIMGILGFAGWYLTFLYIGILLN